MPRYSFECGECDLRFERNLKLGKHESHACPACAKPAPLMISDFGFAFAAGSGHAANSGVHDHDYPSADKAVGRSADQRWEYINRREKVKKAAREKGGTHALIRHTGAGFVDYEPMTKSGENARRAMATAADKAVGKKE